MFERFTEKARRVIFFARYEASNYGSPFIETEHLLLGLLRDDHALVARFRFLGQTKVDSEIRTEIESRIERRETFATSVEVPLSTDSKKVLNLAATEAERLGHRHIGTEHMLLGLLGVEGSLAAQILHARGLRLAEIRGELDSASVQRQPRDAALSRLQEFLGGFKKYNSEELLPFFAKNAHFVDASGKAWDRKEIGNHFETLFILYAKKNATYTIETIQDARDTVVAIVLWKNAVLASMERVWMHRMSVILVPEGEDWAIVSVQVTPVRPS
jgi:ATP-dependent Clp protease ATP-binding subunit ClpA